MNKVGEIEKKLNNSKQDKLELINLMDKLNMQKELLELLKENVSHEKLQLAADRLGKKAQSSFKNK